MLAEDAFVRELNMTYRDQPKATNVLSFPALKGDPVERCDVLAMPLFFWATSSTFETCVVEAQVLDAGAFADPRHLLIHGILHLLGYDHEDDFDAKHMEARSTNSCRVWRR